ncbi:MAG: hypothetical protein AABW61_03405 [Candidatus Aenigmatarchaeota archaeon]
MVVYRVSGQAVDGFLEFNPDSNLTRRQVQRRIINIVKAADPSGEGMRFYGGRTNHRRVYAVSDEGTPTLIVGVVNLQKARELGYASQ